MGRDRIDAIFADLRREGRAALMPFVTGGHPSLAATAGILPALESAGASVVEIGVPFSDPIADGPVIAASMHRALTLGATPASVLETVRRVRPETTMGLVAMVSQSIVERLGAAAFVGRAAESGIDGLIVPDLDLDAAPELRDETDRRGLALSLLVAPGSGPDRLRRIVDLCSGFVYLLARAGLTGERAQTPDVRRHVADIRALSDRPIAVGFGISTPEQVAAVTAHADAAIVGSALVRRLDEADDPPATARAFVARLATGLRGKTES